MVKTKTPKTDPKQLQAQLEETQAKYTRALADYQNLEKRTRDQHQHLSRLAGAALISKLLPILDNLERAATHLQDSGINLILSQFHSILESEGVTIINPVDQPFDPNLMECVDIVSGPEDQVVTVVEKGYLLNETVLRPAKVQVGRSIQQQSTDNPDEKSITESPEEIESQS